MIVFFTTLKTSNWNLCKFSIQFKVFFNNIELCSLIIDRYTICQKCQKILIFSTCFPKQLLQNVIQNLNAMLSKTDWYFFQISGYPEIYLQCTVDDQKLLSIFEVDTGPYWRQKFSYRKRTAPVKVRVKLPLVEERLHFIVRNINDWFYFIKKHKIFNTFNF